jgi:hypothetical protein
MQKICRRRRLPGARCALLMQSINIHFANIYTLQTPKARSLIRIFACICKRMHKRRGLLGMFPGKLGHAFVGVVFFIVFFCKTIPRQFDQLFMDAAQIAVNTRYILMQACLGVSDSAEELVAVGGDERHFYAEDIVSAKHFFGVDFPMLFIKFHHLTIISPPRSFPIFRRAF